MSHPSLRPKEIGSFQQAVTHLQDGQIEKVKVSPVCTEGHLVVVNGEPRFMQDSRVSAGEWFGHHLWAVEAFERIVGHVEVLQGGWKRSRKTDRIDFIVLEFQANQLRAKAGKVLRNLRNVVIGELQECEAFVFLIL